MPNLQEHQSILLPQAYLTNFHNRIRNEPTISLLDTSLAKTQVRGHKRAKVVNYAEFDNDLFDDLIGEENSDNEYSNYNQATSNAGNSANDYNGSNNNNNNNNNNFINSALFDRNNFHNSKSNNNEYGDNLNYPMLSGTHSDSFDNNNNYSNNLDHEDDNYNNNNTTGNTNFSKKIDLKDRLPDLDEQDDVFNVLRYPKIRETFQQSKIVTPYRLDLFKNISMNPPISSAISSILDTTAITSTTTTTTTTDNNIEIDNNSKLEPIIVPIALNIESNGVKIIDHFTWNINDSSMTPEEFANIYCQDLDLQNNSTLNQQIVNTINDLIKEYETVASIKFDQDLQILINLTCHLQDYFLEDNFQWNLNDSSLTPELFAEILVTDLGLKREFLPVVTYSLYETILKVKKEYLEGNSNNTSTNITNLNNEAAFGYLAGVRLNLDDLGENWAPKIELLTPEEIQRKEIEKERKLRRLKRENDRLSRRGRRRLDELELTMKL
ncbi:hypothetical protein RI543_000815 [Arxiozyma heterogenica]|uniref:Chromatin structure-remodeling complex subunit SFH1 n=1 Tax=Arxiozyma heterogenica TaxID=278026 RepID=A0AAN7WTX8_9SACH|nr:hypothetical protein RI543_000815 [Kazachstania heterogenica]